MAKKKKRYVSFYDETFHDRKITEQKKNIGQMNIENIENSDTFLTTNIMFLDHKYPKQAKKFLDFENKTKCLLHMADNTEFKGTTISKKNFKFGIASFHKNSLEIYKNFFEMFDDSFYIQISALSKFELVVDSLFEEMFIPKDVIESNYKYSLIKFLNTYKNKRLVSVFFNENSKDTDILNGINDLLTEVLESIQGVERKMEEELALRQVQNILNESKFTIQAKKKYNWDYNKAFHGLLLFLNELKIKTKSLTLYVDSEELTEQSAKNYAFYNVVSANSMEYEGIRIADIMCNFFGRFIKSIEDEYNEDWDDPNTRLLQNERRILVKEWFEITEEQFSLYIQISNIFYSRKNIYWTIQTGLYWGYFGTVMSLMYYFREYSDFSDYKKFSSKEHREFFNSFSVMREQEMHLN